MSNTTTNEITNVKDIIDSRDVIARIEDLQETDNLDDEEKEELKTLLSLAKEAEGCAPDWLYGEALIRDSYFTEYAQQLAEDCGMVSEDAKWPNNHLDWDAAAEELQQDYASVDFDGVTYWIR